MREPRSGPQMPVWTWSWIAACTRSIAAYWTDGRDVHADAAHARCGRIMTIPPCPRISAAPSLHASVVSAGPRADVYNVDETRGETSDASNNPKNLVTGGPAGGGSVPDQYGRRPDRRRHRSRRHATAGRGIHRRSLGAGRSRGSDLCRGYGVQSHGR